MYPGTLLGLDVLNSEVFSLLVVPLLIFAARVSDVTLGTLRMMFLGRGRKYLAPAFG